MARIWKARATEAAGRPSPGEAWTIAVPARSARSRLALNGITRTDWRRLVSSLLCQCLGPFGEPLFGEISILHLAGPGQPIEIPSPRVWLANHDECDAFAWCQRQGGLGPEQTVFEAGFNQPHGLDGSTVGQPSRPRASARARYVAVTSGTVVAGAPFQTPRVATAGFL